MATLKVCDKCKLEIKDSEYFEAPIYLNTAKDTTKPEKVLEFHKECLADWVVLPAKKQNIVIKLANMIYGQPK